MLATLLLTATALLVGAEGYFFAHSIQGGRSQGYQVWPSTNYDSYDSRYVNGYDSRYSEDLTSYQPLQQRENYNYVQTSDPREVYNYLQPTQQREVYSYLQPPQIEPQYQQVQTPAQQFVHLLPTYDAPQKYQVSPEIPVVVRLPNSETVLLPVRAVYAFPPLFERLVSRIQSYYSVYNNPEHLTLDKPAGSTVEATTLPPQVQSEEDLEASQPQSVSTATTTTSKPEIETNETTTTTTAKSEESKETVTPKVSTLNVYEIRPTEQTETTEDTSTESEEMSTTEVEQETTTDASAYISPQSANLEDGYSYDAPKGRRLEYPVKFKK